MAQPLPSVTSLDEVQEPATCPDHRVSYDGEICSNDGEADNNSPLAVEYADERRFMLCLDSHDLLQEAAVSYVHYLVAPSHFEEPASNRLHNKIYIFGHVHQDSKVPFAARIGRFLGADLPPREERAGTLQSQLDAVSKYLKDSLQKQGVSAETSVLLDKSEMKQLEAYPYFASRVKPHLIFMNERNDHMGVMNTIFGGESWKVHHAVNKCTIVIAKTTVGKIIRGELDEESSHTPDTHFNPRRGLGLHYLVLVDPDLTEASLRAAAVTVELAKPEDRITLYTCWPLPDFATAMYADDARWASELKKHENAARRKVKGLAHQILQATGFPPERVRMILKQDDVCRGVERLVRHRHFHMVVIGGTKRGDPGSTGVSGLLGQAKRRVFGTTADYVISHTKASCVAVAY